MSPVAFLDPGEILSSLHLREDTVAADFGCGSGGWVIPLANKVPDGTVYAIDVQEEPLSALMKKANLQGLSNITKILGDVENGISVIEGGSCDLVLMTNLLFQVEDKQAVFQEASRVLKETGKILVVEWSMEATFGPLQERRVSPGRAKDIALEAGFSLEKEIPAGSYHFGLLLSRA
ncbi:MAG: class I SAM-dependent methyltransferase [Candidatus Pacebacteria bacterium]|nr:class I SAM-dependent methyltransferase [Candidatus Paceibacterota bacterium]